jgi:hypothetical protein
MLIKRFDSKGTEKVIVDKTRVVLVGTYYKPEPTEPVWGSDYGCAGTVVAIYDKTNKYDLQISWDNGEKNPYKLEDLRVRPSRDKNDPNHTFMLKKERIHGRKKSK